MADRSEIGRLIVEAMANLAHVKNDLAERLLVPSGIPLEVCHDVLRRRDVATGQLLTKRRMAPIFIDYINAQANADEIYHQMLRKIANWQDFYLAADEYQARAVVAKAQGVLKRLDQERVEVIVHAEREAEERRAATVREAESRRCRELGELLKVFDDLSMSTDHQQRGYVLQGLLERLLFVCEIPAVRSFQRNAGSEQIDGAFTYKGWHYVVECRWRAKVADVRDIDGLRGQVGRSGKQTMGVFLSIEGWSEHVPNTLRQNPQKDIILIHGGDLRRVLNDEISFERLLDEKLSHLNLYGEPDYRPT